MFGFTLISDDDLRIRDGLMALWHDAAVADRERAEYAEKNAALLETDLAEERGKYKGACDALEVKNALVRFWDESAKINKARADRLEAELSTARQMLAAERKSMQADIDAWKSIAGRNADMVDALEARISRDFSEWLIVQSKLWDANNENKSLKSKIKSLKRKLHREQKP